MDGGGAAALGGITFSGGGNFADIDDCMDEPFELLFLSL